MEITETELKVIAALAGIGTDNLFHTEKRQKFTASLQIANLTNKVALYNFLSIFSGTHFL